MRTPKFLSPTSIASWYSDRDEYYLKYLADNRPPRLPQTVPMSIGAAFDAYVKNYLVERLFGEVPNEFQFETIFTTQVESHNRDWARKHGKHAFEAYKQSGALADLMIELQRSQTTPRFEFTVRGDVTHESVVSGIPLLGKPDCYFVTEAGAHIVMDWKVNGYCAKRGVSPKPGYVKCRDGWEGNHSRSHMKAHKDAHLMNVGGLTINIASFFETVDESWARQLCIYAWLLGEEVGSNFVICIEQLACKADGEFPKIRVASHRARASAQFQYELILKAWKIWDCIQRGHIFDDRSLEDSEARCAELDIYHKAFTGTTDDDEWFAQTSRGR